MVVRIMWFSIVLVIHGFKSMDRKFEVWHPMNTYPVDRFIGYRSDLNHREEKEIPQVLE
jgi:hypothetical protein